MNEREARNNVLPFRPHVSNVVPINRRLRIDEAQHPEKCEAVVLSIYERLIRGSEDEDLGGAA